MLTRVGFSLVIAVCVLSPALAAERQATMLATVRVLPQVVLQPTVEIPAFRVSQADCDAGFAAIQLEYTLRSNDPRGYQLVFTPRLGMASSVEVAGLQIPLLVTGEPVMVTRAVPAGTDRVRLTLRAKLVADVAPGQYPLPLDVTATAVSSL